MALLHSTRLYITLPWLYFTLHCSIMAICQTTFLDQGCTSLYMNLPWLYLTLHEPKSLYHVSTTRYLSLQNSTMALFHSIRLYISPPLRYFTLLGSTLLYHRSTSLYLTLHNSTMALLQST